MQLLGHKLLISPRLLLACKLVAQIELRGPGPPCRQFIVNYCCTRVLLYAKMLKETEKHRFFVTFLSLVPFQLGVRASLGYVCLIAGPWHSVIR